MSLSIILPVYDPVENWVERITDQYGRILSRVSVPIELIIVNDGSAKGISDHHITELKQRIPGLKWISYEKNRGKGFALRQGVKVSTGDVVIYTDIDFPYDLDSFVNIYTSLNAGECDIAVGVKNDNYYRKVPPLRKKISRGLQYLIRFGLSIPITDTQCGLKGFNKSVSALFLEVTIDRYLFDLEFIKKAFKAKRYRIKAIPIQLNDGVVFRNMNFKVLIPEMINFIRLLFK
jgi:glycosyltransferase involved in cell wall biosynthesis